MRLFIAIPLPKDVMKSVWNFEETLRETASGGSFVPRGNHHITLRFIGESQKLAELAYAMHEAVRDARPFPLKLGAYGSFTHGGARTSYLGVDGELSELHRIHQMLESALWEQGFNGGKGRLVPHITLGRGVEHGDISQLRTPNTPFVVRSIVLYESTNERGKMVYTPLHTEKF